MNDQVTVVIPTFNNSKGAIDLIQLLAVHFPAFHLIVVDDGSTDNSWKVIENLASNWTR